MRIGIDVRHLARGPMVGVAMVTRALVEALPASFRNDSFHLFYRGRTRAPAFLGALRDRFQNVTVLTQSGSNRLFDMRARFTGVPKVDELFASQLGERIDVLLSPHTMLAPVRYVPRVLVIHDLSFVVHPGYFSPQSRRWHALMGIRAQAQAAKAIIVPSRATARDLMRFWNISSIKIHVIPWGITASASERSEKPQYADARGRNILFIGTVETRKNVLGLLRAFEILKEDPAMDDVTLSLIGPAGWGSARIKDVLRHSPRRQEISMAGYCTEKEKADALSQAAAFVYPSFYEGFGLPVLEAMAAGVPVVTSNVTSLPEVVGDAAILIDPRRPEEIARALSLILSEKGIAEEFSRRGRKRAETFTWEKTAHAVHAVVENATR